MVLVLAILRLVVLVFFVLLIGRLVLEWVQAFAREWRPRGAALVIAETVYSATDPPLRGLRRVVRPVRLGAIQLDLAFLILMVACSVLLSALPTLA